MKFPTCTMNSNPVQLILAMGLMMGWSQMSFAKGIPVIQEGSTVSFHYTLAVENKVRDSSLGKTPVSYVQGTHQIITGLEEKMVGLKKGDKKHITVKPEKGYGLIDPLAFQVVPISTIKNSKDLKVGQILTGQYNGSPVKAKVMEIGKKEITLDVNHPLAGKILEFDIEIIEIKN